MIYKFIFSYIKYDNYFKIYVNIFDNIYIIAYILVN